MNKVAIIWLLWYIDFRLADKLIPNAEAAATAKKNMHNGSWVENQNGYLYMKLIERVCVSHSMC